MPERGIIFIAIVILFVTLGATGQVVADEHQCNPKGELDFCINEFETNKNTVVKGDVVEGEVSITNTGNESGSTVIIAGLQDSEDSYSYHRLGVLQDIAPGETQSYEFQLEARDDSTVGEHRINVRILDTSEKHLYDSTGYTSSIYLEEDSISLGGIVERFNRLTVGLSALIGIVAYLFGKQRIDLG
jgi:hypothetical protein